MIFLSEREIGIWEELTASLVDQQSGPAPVTDRIRPDLAGMFCFHAGTVLCGHGASDAGFAWFREGAMLEPDRLFTNAFVTAFLARHDHQLEPPAVCFEDPAPFVHWTKTPLLKQTRQALIERVIQSMPVFDHPIRFMDIGPGNGALTRDVLMGLIAAGRIGAVDEIVLVDASAGMLAAAGQTLQDAFDGVSVTAICQPIQQAASQIEGHYDIAMSSLAYHHMPYAEKRLHLQELAGQLDHFLLFELEANNDTPELFSPALSCSLYQCYGRIIDSVFEHDGPIELAERAVDDFLMVELISFMSQRRGERSDYHMLRQQWHAVLSEGLGSAFGVRGQGACNSDPYNEMFMLHYGRD